MWRTVEEYATRIEVSSTMTKREVRRLRDSQERMTAALLDFDTTCRELGIKYWTISGTLLGQERHKGWIPWDADIDLGMELESYERLRKHRNSLPGDLWLQERSTDHLYNDPWGKIRVRGTCYVIEDKSTHNGFQLDLFLFQRKGDKLVCVTSEGRECGDWKSGNFVPGVRSFPADWVFPLRRAKFEGIYVWSPRRPTKLLAKWYGNWKELPSRKDRYPHEIANGGVLDPDTECVHHEELYPES